ncbi:SIR2 family protein [Deinococcus wulumuqiensis]|nr:SIR2 family protein [Deinococcus wulumuqiensis]
MIYEYIIKEIKASITANHYLGSHLGNIDKAVAKLVDEKLKAAQGKGSFYLRDEVGKGVEAILKASTSEWARKMQNPSSLHNDDISREIGKLIDSTREKSGEGAIFSRTNDLMIALLKDLVYINDTSKVDYISPIFRVLDSQPSLTVATLNYDNVIELAGDVYGKQVNTGIGQWSHTGEIEISSLGVNLLKIHGSITWSTNNGRRNGRQAALPTYQISEIQADKISEADFYPAVIFGGKNKLKADGPFLDLLRAFNYELKKCDILTVIGYSFRDEHINVYITRWLNGNDKRRIRIVNGPSFIADINNGMLPDYATYLLQLVQSGRVEIIPLYARDGIAQLFGEQLTPVHQQDIEISSTAFEKALEKEKLASDYIMVSEANAHHEASDAPD